MKAEIQSRAVYEERERLAMIAHDLRAPMCCVSGAAQIALLKAKQGKTVEEQLQQILHAVTAMDRMIGSLCNERETDTAAAQLEQELRALAAPRAAVKYQRVSIELSALYGQVLPFSSDALYRVLSNLLLNAIKYTQEGGEISLCASIVCSGIGETAVFSVCDSGMGMKADFIRRMYEPKARAKESAGQPGDGLGLAIVRRLVAQMGGEISVNSEWGKGTEFSVHLPLQRYAVCQ